MKREDAYKRNERWKTESDVTVIKDLCQTVYLSRSMTINSAGGGIKRALSDVRLSRNDDWKGQELNQETISVQFKLKITDRSLKMDVC